MRVYVDTSVLVAALVPEQVTEQAQEWLAGQPPGSLLISDWIVTEFSSALALKLRTRQIEPAHRTAALATFSELVEQSLVVLRVSRSDFTTAAQLVDQYTTGLRAGDALHLALASRQRAQLTSLDRVLVRAATELGMEARLLD